MPVNFDEHIERIQSEKDLFVKAQLIESLIKDEGYTIRHVAQALGISSSYICNLFRMLTLPELVRDGYYMRHITMSHLSILSRLHNPKEVIALYEEILQNSISTTELEVRVREILHKIESKGSFLDEKTMQALVEKFESIDGRIQARVIQSRIRGKIIIEMKGDLLETTKVFKKVLDS